MFNKFKISFILLFVLLNQIFANEIEDKISRGVELSYNFQFESANDIFDELIRKFPNDPQSYHYKSSILLWKFASDKNEKDFEKFFSLSEIAIEKSEAILKDDDKNSVAFFILGSNYGLRSIAYLKAGESLKAVWAVKKARSYLNDLKKSQPENFDANLGLGLFDYSLSFTPGFFKWALNIAGISGNRDEGIKNLKIALKNGKKTKIEAAYYLSQVYSDAIIDYEKALNYIKPLAEKFPENELFNYSYGVILLKSKRLNEAENVLWKIADDENSKLKQIKAFSHFLLGDISFRQNKFAQAIQSYNSFLMNSTDIDYSGIAFLRKAISNKALGKESEVIENLNLAGNGNLDIADDIYAKRKSIHYLKNGFSAKEIELIKSVNLVETGNSEKAIKNLEILSKELSGDEKLLANYYLSEAYFENNEFEKSLKTAEAVINSKAGEEKWLIPFSYLNAARAAEKMGLKIKTKSYLKEIEKFNDFDFEVKLKGFVEGLKDRSPNV